MFDSPFSKDFKNRKIKMKFREDIEPHEILLDKLARKKEEEGGLSEQKFETPLLKQILDGLFFVSIFLFFLLFAKTFQLGVIEGGNLSAQAEENKYIFHKIQAERGVIYDRNFNQLVSNQPSFDLICVKNDLPQEDSEKNRVFKEVSQILKLEIEDLEKKIRSPENKNPQVSVFEGLSHQNLIVFETKITSGNLPGFQIENSTTRYYEDGVIFSHLIGYTGKIKTEELKATPGFYSINDYVGRAGIENFYEEDLRKNPGEFRIERDALGNVIATEVISLPEPGNSLVLSMDAGLQKKLQEELEKELKVVGVKRAAAVALDPRTGGVLSLVSLPSFDNNLFNKGADPKSLNKLLEDPYNLQPLFNRAISGGYLIGSTIKPLVASAALEEKIISPQKKIYCEGLITIPNLWDPSLPTIKKDNAIHGWTDLKKALAESCNVFFYTIGGGYKDQTGLGPTKIKEYLKLFGWSEKTGIDLPGEAAGFIPDKEWKKKILEEGWWDGDTYNLAIGQGYLKITPLEVAASFASIANGGKLLRPMVVKEVIDNEKNVIEEMKPKIIRENFIDSENLQIVREGMRQAVTGLNSPQASAVLLNSLPVSAAAKTGTAELGGDFYNNWVTVFAPYEDPQIVLTVVIENVKGVQAAALPVAKEVLNWYFTQEPK